MIRDKNKLKALLQEAVREALETMGLEEFRKTSFFGSNQRRGCKKTREDRALPRAA